MSTNDGRTPGRRVLIVDDSVDTVKMMKLLLKREGYDVDVAFDGPEAIEIARSRLPEIVLLDLTLPSMDGQEVASTLRTVEGLTDALIVAISGYGLDEIPEGFDHLLVKPLNPDDLRKLLSEHRSSADPAGDVRVLKETF